MMTNGGSEKSAYRGDVAPVWAQGTKGRELPLAPEMFEPGERRRSEECRLHLSTLLAEQ